ncbi:helix-turn-helix domain-containing protein [Petroclostridium sp. X23]|uniref:helix-turn-helix domain-containing protein n=1 Tax=Petroclostridium sp. X23 TaxID=3045146 RepID=UPI0024ACC5FC|nr:helix-turn-helix domain-containing protein [Petroclostridium sp. X23]WHH57082.1 helix-turn-helix domain-containing protein [Petroclostridium sp. X23]
MKQYISLEFISIYKNKSVFLRTFCMLIILSLILAGCFYYFSINLMSDNLKKKTYTSNINMLSKTESAMDLAFSYITQAINLSARNEYVISAVVVPGLDRPERNFEVIKHLYETAKNSSLIKCIFLYVNYDNTIFSSDGTVTELDNFNKKDIIEEYNQNPQNCTELLVNQSSTSMRVVNGRIFMFRDFPLSYENRNATLIFEIDTLALYELVQGAENNLSKEIYIYDEYNHPVFINQLDYSNIDFSRKINEYTQDKQYGYFIDQTKPGKNIYFYFRSRFNKWRYIYPVAASSIKLTSKGALTAIVPLLIIFLAISLFFSLYITRSIYNPIKKLMLTVMQIRSENKVVLQKTKNEFDFLGLAYADAVDKSKHLTQLMEGVAPIVLEKLLSNLLFNKETSLRNIEDTLNSIGNPFYVQNNYVVLAAQVFPKDHKEMTYVQTNLYRISIDNIVNELKRSDVAHYCLQKDNTNIVLILSFSTSLSAIEIKHHVISLSNQIIERVQDLPFNIIIGRGGVYNGIADIRFSYHEARNTLSYQVYLSDAKKYDALENTVKQDAFDFDDQYLKEKTRQFIVALKEENDDKTLNLATGILQHISTNITDLAKARQKFEIFVDAIFEVLIEYKVDFDSEEFNQKRNIDRDLNSFVTIAQMEHYTRLLCEQAIQIVNVYNKKRQHKYVVRVKEYIENNYFDRTLSLNTVSEQINISPSYLSKIFKDTQNQNFIDYLNAIRVDKAKQLLKSTGLTVKDIGYKTGFSTIQNFIRVFKRYERMPPGQYKKKMLERK